MKARPLVGRTRVVRTPTVVDLPAPLGPRRQKISPGKTSREMPSRATISGLGCLPLALGFGGPKEKPPVPAATGGAEVKTLRRSTVRMPATMLDVPLRGNQEKRLATRALRNQWSLVRMA